MILGITSFTSKGKWCPIAYRTPFYRTTNKLLPLHFMSHTRPTISSSSNFQLVVNNALDKYKKRTKNDLIAHPLAAQLQSCNSPSAILVVLQQQVLELGQSRSSDERWSRWLDPTVSVIYALSSTVAACVSLVCLRTRPCLRFATLHFLAGFLTCECHFCRYQRPPFGAYSC